VAGAYAAVLSRVDVQSARDAAVGGAAMGYSVRLARCCVWLWGGAWPCGRLCCVFVLVLIKSPQNTQNNITPNR
jgi:hypothetical protein